jgi:hypothetical protein
MMDSHHESPPSDELVALQPAAAAPLPYASANGRAKFVVSLFVIGILLALAMLGCDLRLYELMVRMIRNDQVPQEQIGAIFRWQHRFSISLLLWYFATVVAFLMWTHRAHRNLPALGATGLQFTPWSAVGWYFAPFFNFFKPYQAMREIYNASRPDESSESDLPWRFRNAPAVVKTWWPLFLLMNVTGNAVGRAWTHAEAPSDYRFVAAISIVDNAISVAAMFAAIWLIWSVSRRQALEADEIGIASVPQSDGI